MVQKLRSVDNGRTGESVDEAVLLSVVGDQHYHLIVVRVDVYGH